MTSGTSKIEKSTFSKHDNSMAIRENPLVNLRFNIVLFDIGPFFKSSNINFIIKMSNISDNGVVFHLSHMFSHNDIFITSSSDNNINFFNYVFKFNNLDTFHTSLKSTDWINFSNIDSGSASFHGLSTTFTNITISTNKNFFTSKHNISSSENTIR